MTVREDLFRKPADNQVATRFGIPWDKFLGSIETLAARQVAFVTTGNADAEIGGLTIGATYSQAEVQALRDKCEELADDVRAIKAAMITSDAMKAS